MNPPDGHDFSTRIKGGRHCIRPDAENLAQNGKTDGSFAPEASF
jgi:hypothetical protein